MLKLSPNICPVPNICTGKHRWYSVSAKRALCKLHSVAWGQIARQLRPCFSPSLSEAMAGLWCLSLPRPFARMRGARRGIAALPGAPTPGVAPASFKAAAEELTMQRIPFVAWAAPLGPECVPAAARPKTGEGGSHGRLLGSRVSMRCARLPARLPMAASPRSAAQGRAITYSVS